MDQNDKKPLDFYTGKMSHLNNDRTVKLNPNSVFAFKDMPSCLYRTAHKLAENPYMSAQSFFKDMSFHESMQLYNMVNLMSANDSGKIIVNTPPKEYMLNVSRVAVMKGTELLCYGSGEHEVHGDAFMKKLLIFGAMVTVHFMSITSSVVANYDKFDIHADSPTDFISGNPDENEEVE